MKARNLEKNILTTLACPGSSKDNAFFGVHSIAFNSAKFNSTSNDKEILRTRGLQLVWVKTDLSGKGEVQRSSSLGSQEFPPITIHPSLIPTSLDTTQFTHTKPKQTNQNQEL
jgi:hypothetical protein